LTYQWRKDGTNLVNQTSETLVLNNVGPDDGGIYTVEITDQIGAAVSEPALLRILIQPLIMQAPVSQAIIPGSTVTFSVSVTNTATLPVGYRWRTNKVFMTNAYFTLNSRTAFITFTNLRPPLTNISVVTTNFANTGGRLSTDAIITYVTDFDEDGTPDWWEHAYGFATNNLGDADLDFDNDKMSNRAEYIAGTNPTNSLSYLKVEPLAGSPTGATIQFFAVSNRTYTVEYADVVEAVPWHQLAHLPARTTNHLATIQDQQATPERFYRLVTPRQE
jgi:hypothetical protein